MIHKEFYIPFTIELLFDFFGKYDIKINDNYTRDSKEKVLKAISILLEQKIIFVGNWSDNKEFIIWELSNSEILLQIDLLWKKDIKFHEFYNLVWFGYQKWYIDGLNNKGFGKEKISWNIFIEERLGNLELWIEENKPKN